MTIWLMFSDNEVNGGDRLPSWISKFKFLKRYAYWEEGAQSR
jgi:hypothetical protein